MKAWFQSKMMWLGIGVGVLGVFEAAVQTNPLPEPWGGIVTAVIGGAIVVLRKVTTTSIGPSA